MKEGRVAFVRKMRQKDDKARKGHGNERVRIVRRKMENGSKSRTRGESERENVEVKITEKYPK